MKYYFSVICIKNFQNHACKQYLKCHIFPMKVILSKIVMYMINYSSPDYYLYMLCMRCACALQLV